MIRRTVTAGLSLAVIAGMTVVLAAQATSAAPPKATPVPNPLALALNAADRAAASGLDALAKGPNEQYDRHMVTPWVNGLYSIAYQRTYRGLPVVGGDAAVLADGQGAVRAIAAATSAKISIGTLPSVTAATAEQASRARLPKVDSVESRRLVVHVKDDTPRLAWETVLVGRTATAPSHLHVFVDARSGAVLAQRDDVVAGTGTGKWNGPNPLTIATTQSGSTYSLRDPAHSTLSCGDYANSTVFSGSDDVWGNGVGTSKETGCVDVMYAAQKQWDMLVNWLGRNGHNGNGGSWPTLVGLGEVNAYWDGSRITIGRNQASEWISAMDVVGHEYGHGIDQNTPGGTSQEAGLGEGTGDIFGALTEAYANQSSAYDPPDFTVGEEINLTGNGPIRNMYNPSLVGGDPNCYSSSIPGTEVHAAAGPLNHWFYLLSEGNAPGGGKPSSPICSGGPSSVTGVGIQTAGKIFYGGMLLKTSGMTYKKYRIATLTAAKNLDSTCNLYNRTKDAWNAITLPAQSGEPTCTAQSSDFTIATSPTSGTVQPGNSVTSTVSTTTIGTAQTVNLSASGAPSGVTVSFSPSSVTSGNSSTMTVAASAGAAAGTYTITVTGTGSVTHTAQYTLTVGTVSQNDFSIGLNPGSGNVAPGASTTSTVNTATTSGSAQTVSLSASGAPSGVTVSFSPSSVTSGNSSTMTVAAAASTTAGTYTITVTGSGSVSRTAQYTLTVGTVSGGVPDINVANVQAHLTQLQTIATNNGGNRRSTTNGYLQSVAYVKGKLQTAGYTVTEQPCTSGCTAGAGPNLIAEWPQGNADNVYMFGAHLDSVSAGPGMNDNGSGSAALLENALVLAATNPTMTNRIRFGWWTDEEQGLNGSEFYANSLSSANRAKIKAYYNFDMIASKNGGYFINNVNSTASAPMKAYWTSLGLAPEENVEGQGRSDDASFQAVGIPTSGYAMGASATKTSAQATKWGGTAGAAYDSCYHSSCDTTTNINATGLNRAADGIAYTIWDRAVGSTPANDFSVGLNPGSGSVQPGSSVTSTVSTATTSGSAQTVSLSASGAPSGVTVSFSPSSVTSGNSSTMTVAASASAATGTYTITVTGSGSVTRTATYSLTIGTAPANDFSIAANPSSGSANRGSSVTTTVSTATVSGSAQTVSLSASGAPSGVTVSFSPSSVTSGNSSTATISVGASTALGTYTITITGSGSVSHSTTYTITVTGTGGCTPAQVVSNGGFESGVSPWTGTTTTIGVHAGQPAHSGVAVSYLVGYGYASTETINQSVTIPAGCTSAVLTYWLHIDTAEYEAVAYDTFRVRVNGTTLTTLSNVNAAAGYTQRTVNLGAYAGQTVTLTFTATEDTNLQTSFVVDDVTLQVS
ncbi:Zn-dependent metalloprotease/uncharacterized membrane protein [Allocatelliglobosispora scoriae]|uniref:Zn-dependent metalloprotease/uncharacterized membrane protein n=1 Tax=Allocatelliglobosispora scoriae TaxID=643052 RepID=A0A841BTX4_9ACTN|nr:M28 family peptidase [Allocatelliglobosispora scoriae]MBB5871145.1 Zn-dependent metalloprotease/uncharacterized membrane protein [Allocatelliglobosispora scoriae]